MSRNAFRLLTLGRVALLSPAGEREPSLGKRPRKLAVLAYLALARKPVQRTELLELFWGGQEEERARHSLSDALSHIRRVLGPESVSARRAEIALAGEAGLVVDALELVSAAARGDYARVLELYQGAFLAGVEVEDSPAFEGWLLRERERLRLLVAETCEVHGAALMRDGAWSAAAEVSHRWLEADPLSPEAALALLSALRAPGTPDGHRRALSEYRQLAARLGREHDWEPDDRVSALAATIAREADALAPDFGGHAVLRPALTEPTTTPAASVAAPKVAGVQEEAKSRTPLFAPAPGPTPESTAPPRPGGGRGRRRGRAIALGASMLLLGALAFAGGARLLRVSRASAAPAAAVAVLDVNNLTAAPGDAWLEQGLPQMIGAALFRSGGLEVVPPERVRDVRRRVGEGGGELGASQALDMGRRLGARAIARGGFSHGAGGFVLDLTVYDVTSGRVLQMFTVSAASVLKLADAAAARLAGMLGGDGAGPAVAEAETSSLEAYRHYMRGLQAHDEGRYAEAESEVAAALAADSGFVAALRLRAQMADEGGDAATPRAALAGGVRASDRASPFDRLEVELTQALYSGQRERPEELGRELVARYPHDPRAYRALANVLFSHGAFAAEEDVLEKALALDSLGMEAGRGPCVPCMAYQGLALVRTLRGDAGGAVAAARRWVRLQPDVPSAWFSLGSTLSAAGDFPAAEDADRRASLLEPGVLQDDHLVRTWITGGAFPSADSALTEWERAARPEQRESLIDLRATLEREQGQLRAAAATLRRLPPGAGISLVLASNLARTGQWPEALRIFEAAGHPREGTEAQRARAYCWAHALEADALAAGGDTARVRVLADSIDVAARASYYARDWRLAYHLRGLLALRAGRYAEAERELQAARFGVGTWTATNLALARAQLALGRPRDAVRTLQEARLSPLDGMGRYVPRTEIEYQLARAWAAAGQADSARAAAARVRRAWAQADPEVRTRLAALP